MADDTHAKRVTFRELLARDRTTVMPGGFSPLYARMAELAGFEAFFVAGSQMSAFLLGVPDTGIIGLRDVVDQVRHVAARTGIPVFADADTGFGNAVNVHYAVQEIVGAGAAGLSIEDQEAPKKSGTGSGRRCISIEEAVGKYRAATAARDELDPAFVVCARCDVLGPAGGDFDEALERCVAYAREGRVDLIWLNSAQTREQIERVCATVPAPVLIGWSGADPGPTFEEYERLGARVALFPTVASMVGLEASWQFLNEFRTRGTAALTAHAAAVKASPWGPANRRKLIGNERVRELEEAFLPAGSQRDYAEGASGERL